MNLTHNSTGAPFDRRRLVGGAVVEHEVNVEFDGLRDRALQELGDAVVGGVADGLAAACRVGLVALLETFDRKRHQAAIW